MLDKKYTNYFLSFSLVLARFFSLTITLSLSLSTITFLLSFLNLLCKTSEDPFHSPFFIIINSGTRFASPFTKFLILFSILDERMETKYKTHESSLSTFSLLLQLIERHESMDHFHSSVSAVTVVTMNHALIQSFRGSRVYFIVPSTSSSSFHCLSFCAWNPNKRLINHGNENEPFSMSLGPRLLLGQHHQTSQQIEDPFLSPSGQSFCSVGSANIKMSFCRSLLVLSCIFLFHSEDWNEMRYKRMKERWRKKRNGGYMNKEYSF